MDVKSSQGRASYWTQANALLRKNLTFQKRNISANIRLIAFPFFLCILLVSIQFLINSEFEGSKYKCGCTVTNREKVCGVEYSTLDQAASCPVTSPPEWPALLQIPSAEHRATRTSSASFTGLPNESCRNLGTCPATVLLTGQDKSLGDRLVANLFATTPINATDVLYSLAKNALGSDTFPENSNFLDPAFITDDHPLYRLQTDCTTNSSISVPVRISSTTIAKDTVCVQSNLAWRNTSSEINDELFKGYYGSNKERRINEILAAYDFQNSNVNNFNTTVWYNATYKNDTGNQAIALLRLPRSVNMVSNSYLNLLHGVEMLLDFVKEMPKPQTKLSLDLVAVLGPLFFTWVILQLFPVILTSLVYEKEQKLRIMMKMHGLGDGPYWMITYGYFLVVSATYMICFVLFGSGIGLKFFTQNDYSIQFVFYFIYINLQISLAFLVAAMFSNTKTASVIGYILVFGTGLLGGFLFQFFVEDETFSRTYVFLMELYPGFALYRGLMEFAQYAAMGDNTDTHGMRWGDLSDSDNGLRTVCLIMLVEWLVVLCVAYYVDQVISAGSGVGRSPLFFLDRFKKKRLSSTLSQRRPSLDRQESKVFVQMDKPDVAQEREKVDQLVLEPSSHAVVCDNLKKVYPRRDGNPPKFAVRGMSLALPQGECFGMLGPNGAGKTSFISMMIGLIKPSSGAAYVQGLDIRSQMNEIYNNMGVCPQHDLLWESLTGREHLLFYGRLKNLTGSTLTKAVEESLTGVNLFSGGVADKQAGKYSGGMKRRLSVAISLIGDPKVVYMDEPSTGLDPASRNSLWKVVKKAKKDRAIILTTHSMEEAEHLCDRLGIFVDGSLQCIGNPKELKARYGGSYVFTMTTSSTNETEVENMVRKLSPNANKIYHLSGTQKFELPKNEVRIADVFQAVEKAKSKFVVHAWGLADTTLEDVFIKVARGAQTSNVLL